MIFDPITWFLLVLLIILLAILIWLFKEKQTEPWVMYDSISTPERTTEDACGDSGILVSINNVRNLNVHVELENRGDCMVSLFIGGNAFLEAKAPQAPLGKGVTYVTAFVPLPKGARISYKCATDEMENPQCVFRARVTVR